MNRPTLLLSLVLSTFIIVVQTTHGQSPRENREERFRQMSEKHETRGLAEPFQGLTTDGEVKSGLFTIESTGVSTAEVRTAANTFIGLLSDEQKKRTLHAVIDDEWRKWMNQHFYVRQGTGFKEMTRDQREAALGMMRASLSAKGMRLSRDIMKLNHTLGELNGDNFEEYGEWLYWITIMGEPSADEPWGWQVDGHHLIINYFVLGDQVVMSPVFVGSEPVTATSGKFAGTSILQEEQDSGLSFLLSLGDDQREKAIIDTQKDGNNNLGEAFRDNLIVPYAGLCAQELDAASRQRLLDLISLFIDNMDEGHATIKMDEIRTHIESTWFSWVGDSSEESPYYYRIHSPVVFIEFDHQRPANLRHLAKDPGKPTREHVHIVIRTPNGNDYGKDLLRQHLEAHPH